MKWLTGILLVLFLSLQYRLWIGEGSVEQIAVLKNELEEQKKTNLQLENRNKQLAAEIEDLRTGLETLEERARSDMGMIKEGETYYLFVDRRTLVNQANILPEQDDEEPGEHVMENEILQSDLQGEQ
ncbi:MAG: cell division protein FtsB [Pseudomonadales bacterium]|nr:cell division protein FtsB [Pseudomonadales bacterium]